MGKVKRILSGKKALAGLATAFLVLVLVVIGFASQGGGPVLGQWGYGYGYGYTGAGTLGASADDTPPVISGTSISASVITDIGATITWTTDEPSTSQVEYWPGSLSSLDSTRVTSHSVTLTGLTPGTTYHYKTMSVDAAGNLAVSDEHTFTTLAAAPGAPVISAVSASDVNDDSAVIRWTTDESSTSQVEYWVPTSSLSPLDSTLVTSHSVTLTDLTSETTYHFKVRSSDAAGNLAISGEYTFTTSAAGAGANWALIGGIIGGVIAAGGLAWYLLWKRRG